MDVKLVMDETPDVTESLSVKPRVIVAGLGPAGAELVPTAARAALSSSKTSFLRTRHHPAAEEFPDAVSFDQIYESSASFEEVYESIASRVIEAAHQFGEVVYAVPGSPLVAERSVELIRANDTVEVEMILAASFLDLAWQRLGCDPISEGVHLIDATEFSTMAAGETGPFLVAQCWSKEILSNIKLSVEDEPVTPVVVLSHLGLPDERVYELPWGELDRSIDADHLTSLFIPELADPVGARLVRLDEVVHQLRQRCPWDREQTHASLIPQLIEEAYEVVDAITEARDAEDDHSISTAYEHLEEELGDLLLQVYMHSVIAAEHGWFTLSDVAKRLLDKLIYRHPHVFGNMQVSGVDEVIANWDRLKQKEKPARDFEQALGTALPSLIVAAKVLAKANTKGVSSLWLERGRRALSEVMAGEGEVDSSLAGTEGSSPQPSPSVSSVDSLHSTPMPSYSRDFSAGRPDDPFEDANELVGWALLYSAGLAVRYGVDAETTLRRLAVSLAKQL